MFAPINGDSEIEALIGSSRKEVESFHSIVCPHQWRRVL
ncbi:hypothetical protein LBWT_X4210 (plasmid) [Leptolyngbya boryana IAM M-101]|nr:hypothetical protein LBWT_X4210 [Leptolyngbya boryana IAM M-101]BAS66697.1 hypothetical protein LBDG_X4210 [Leptolyngbya boryana dg5]